MEQKVYLILGYDEVYIGDEICIGNVEEVLLGLTDEEGVGGGSLYSIFSDVVAELLDDTEEDGKIIKVELR